MSAEAVTTEAASGLTGLDWVVIIAATAALVVGTVWLIQGRPLPGAGPAKGDDE